LASTVFGFSALRFSVRRRQHHLPRQNKVSFNLTVRFPVAVGFACNALSRAWTVAALRRNSENPGLHELVFDFARECARFGLDHPAESFFGRCAGIQMFRRCPSCCGYFTAAPSVGRHWRISCWHRGIRSNGPTNASASLPLRDLFAATFFFSLGFRLIRQPCPRPYYDRLLGGSTKWGRTG